MSTQIVVPEVGESIADARVARWLKKEGDAVAAGEPVVELETDKVDLEVAAPKAGVIETITHGDGADVKIGDVLGTIREGAGAAAAAPAVASSAAEPPAAPAAAPSDGEPPAAPAASPAGEPPAAATTTQAAPAPLTPSARRLAREKNVDVAAVQPSGPRVTKSDVERSLAGRPTPPAPRPAASPAAAQARAATEGRPETRQRMSKRRATIARRLVEAQHTAAMLTTFNEADMSVIMALRERRKESFKAAHGVPLGIASFFVKASIAALRAFPRFNAEIQGDEIVLKHYYDIGIAVAAEEGLVVPVLRDADRLSFAEIETGIRDFAVRAREGKLTLDDLRGGTFSITNGGVFGSLLSTPILNPPQVGILGLHAIKERPIVAHGQLVARPMMYLALTYDHRMVDGAEAVQFLVRIKELVEEPGTMLIES
jgi:2-oxoglutarate dehydrogenase E2 component (dihydrolipoamide succinyltransferase)